jgi:subtilisin family serine protease
MFCNKSKFMLILGSTLALLVLTFSMAPAAMASPQAVPLSGDVVADEVVVSFEKGTTEDDVKAAAARAGAEVVRYNADTGLALFKLVDGRKGEAGGANAASDEASAALDAIPGVVAAEPNYIYRSVEPVAAAGDASSEEPLTYTLWAKDYLYTLPEYGGTETYVQVTLEDPLGAEYPGDPEILETWGWWFVGADVAWGGKYKPPTVAILDTGVAPKHPELKKTVKEGYDFVNDQRGAEDDNGHGTHLAGIIGADKSKAGSKKALGIKGVSNGKGVAYKVLDANGSGTMYDVAEGIYEAADAKGVSVINLSLTGPYSVALEDAVEYAVITRGRLLVVAAGNDGVSLACDGLGGADDPYPACFSNDSLYNPLIAPGLIVVEALGDPTAVVNDDVLDPEERFCMWTGSNYNSSFVDIAAPGYDVYSTLPNYPVNGDYPEGFGYMTGTSQATAHVSAAAAMVWGLDSDWTAAEVKTRLTANGRALPTGLDCTAGAGTGSAPDVPVLWLPGAMELSGFWGYLYDADTGAAIPGAKVTPEVGGKSVGKYTVCMQPPSPGDKGKKYCSHYDRFFLLNIPDPTITPVDISVDDRDHADGDLILEGLSPPSNDRWYVGYVTLPKSASGRWNFVVNWEDTWLDTDLNTYLFMPAGAQYYEDATGLTALTWVGSLEPDGVTVVEPWASGDLMIDPWARVLYDSNFGPDSAYWNPRTNAGQGAYGGLQSDSLVMIPTYSGEHLFVVANSLVGGDPPGTAEDTCAYVWNGGSLVFKGCGRDATVTNSVFDPFWVIGRRQAGGAWQELNLLTDDDCVTVGPGECIDNYTPQGTSFDEPLPGGGGPLPTGE